MAGLMLFTFNETSDRITRLEHRITRLEDSIDARFATVNARFATLEKNQQEIALTLARLVALFEAHDEAATSPFAQLAPLG